MLLQLGTGTFQVTINDQVTTTNTDQISVALGYKFGTKFKTTADVSSHMHSP